MTGVTLSTRCKRNHDQAVGDLNLSSTKLTKIAIDGFGFSLRPVQNHAGQAAVG
jgi:hypothetical protein